MSEVDLGNIDNKSNIISRGHRLRRVRNLANESRKDFSSGVGVSVNTLKTWELGSLCGLSKDGAKKVVNHLAEKGVICTIDWLLYETGSPPKLINLKYLPSDNHFSFVSAGDIDLALDEKLIANEILYFKDNYKEIMNIKIQDNSMEPVLKEGDFVSGVKFSKESLHELIDSVCIVQLDTEEIIVRYLQWNAHENIFFLRACNISSIVSRPIIYSPNIVCIAAVTRVYKILPKSQ